MSEPNVRESDNQPLYIGYSPEEQALLKSCKKELSKPMFTLWRSSLHSGLITAELLLVLISPIHMGGSRGAPKNYRPVLLTEHLIKVFERVVRRVLVRHIDRQGLLPSGQHGSWAMRSTLTTLLSHWDSILDGLERGEGVDAVYLDFSKAFDSISNEYIYESLKFFNFGDYFIKIVRTMLTGRTCTVMIDGYETLPFNIERGVPQGDTASPYLFILVLEI